MNRVTLIGQLTADPEQTTTAAGQAKATFRIATNYGWKDADGEWQNGVDFHRVVTWRSVAQHMQGFKKGDGVFVEGKLQTRSWVTESGEKRYSTEILANSVAHVEQKNVDPEEIQHSSEVEE